MSDATSTTAPPKRRRRPGTATTPANEELERRRLQNRNAQRKYRSSVQQRLQEYDQLKAVLHVTEDTASSNDGGLGTDGLGAGAMEDEHDAYAVCSPRMAARTAQTTPNPVFATTATPYPALSMIAHVVHDSEQPTIKSAAAMDTPLHIAAAGSSAGVVRLLLRKGAIVDMLNADYETALHVAAARGHVEIVACLLEAGAGTAVTDSAGMMPLHRAVAHGHTQVARRLAIAGADLNARSGGFHSPTEQAGSGVGENSCGRVR